MHTPSYIKYICSKTITHITHPGDMFGKQSCKSLTFENAHKQQSECNTVDCMTHPVTSSYCECRFLWNSGWMTLRLQNYAENFHACCNHGGLFWVWEATSKNNLPVYKNTTITLNFSERIHLRFPQSFLNISHVLVLLFFCRGFNGEAH